MSSCARVGPGLALLLGLVLVAYADAPGASFVFDDILMLHDLPREPSEAFEALFLVRKDATSAGRPLMATSWVANTFAAHWPEGDHLPSAWGFHVFNVAVHLATCVVFFLLIRGLLGAVPELSHRAADAALVAASIWGVHPLTTSSITYAAQRAEALMALFFLGALLCAWRSLSAPGRPLWIALATACAWLAVAGKEIGVLVPIAFGLVHRALVPQAFGAELRRHARLYLGLASCLLPFLALQATDPRGATVAWFSEGMNPWSYLLTQAGALVTYARLAVWPDPLLLDYGYPVIYVGSWSQLASELPRYGPALAAVAAVFSATCWALARHPRAALPTALSFLVLAPSSSVLPINSEIMAEHRMYLPLAFLVGGGVAALATLLGSDRRRTVACGALWLALLALEIPATRARNLAYHEPRRLWEQNVAATPENPRAFAQLGAHLMNADQPQPARRVLLQAAELAERSTGPARAVRTHVHQQLGRVERRLGRPAEAIDHFERSLAASERNYGSAAELIPLLVSQGRPERALEVADRMSRLFPDSGPLTADVVFLELQVRRDAQARERLARFLAREPADPEVARALMRIAERASRSDLVLELMGELRQAGAGREP